MYAVIDIEGNGAPFRKESIIEIAIFRYDGHKIVDQFISLVNPESEITPFVQKLTSISPKMVKTAPKFHEIAKRIIEITTGATLVGHNIDFDYRMLRQSFKRLGYDFKVDTLDTIPLAKKLLPDAESYSLGKLVRSLGIPLANHHRADGDARATLELFKVLRNKDTENEIIQLQHDESNAKTYTNKVKNLTQDLPNEQGIIYFQDKTGKILFADFTENISKTAKKLFNLKSKRWKDIQEHTEQINYDLAGNKIVAKLLMKSKNIHKKEALIYGLYNHQGKYLAEKISLQPNKTPIVKFASFTQALKAVHFIKSEQKYQNLDDLLSQLELQKRNELWTMNGRTLGEKTFLIIENGKVTGYGFYDLFHQIKTRAKINQLNIEVHDHSDDMQNLLKLALLKGEVETFPLPTK